MATRDNDPFADWSGLVHMPVYSVDRKKLGYLRAIYSDYMIIVRGVIKLIKYFIPKSAAESVTKYSIKLRITAYEANSNYSYLKMENYLKLSEYSPGSIIGHKPFYDRLLNLGYYATRNRLAAGVAFISSILFLLSGYKANLEIYSLIKHEIEISSASDFLVNALTPIDNALAILSQFGGILVLIGSALFAANRVNLAKFCVMFGTGQGLLTVGLHILFELSSGRLSYGNNYLTWLTSSATGLGILFALCAPSISKGKGDRIVSRVFKFILGKK
ncbi:MAG TPA: hypothetical protein VIZ62_11065 [Nitrososphaeraceae archaeon]